MHPSMSADEVLAIVGLALAIVLAIGQTWYASREMRTFIRMSLGCRRSQTDNVLTSSSGQLHDSPRMA